MGEKPRDSHLIDRNRRGSALFLHLFAICSQSYAYTWLPWLSTSQPPPRRWLQCEPSLRPGLGAPPLLVPSLSQIWSGTSVTWSSTQHWPSPTMTQTGRRKQGLEGEPDLLSHWVSYDQLTLQLYIKLSGPMNMCTPLKDSRPCMSL